MVKIRIDSTIEIWSADYVNKTYMRKEADEDTEIVQIERANHNGTMFIVEVVRKNNNVMGSDMYPKIDIGNLGNANILLCKEDKDGIKPSTVV